MQRGPETAEFRRHNLKKAAQQLQNRLRLVAGLNQLSQAAAKPELCSLAMSRNRFC
jgi:hypothetical protein